MANHKSALKAHRTSVKRNAINNAVKSRVKTFITKTEKLVSASKLEEAVQSFRISESEIMKSVSKGVLKLNTASRKVSKLARKVKNLESVLAV